MTPADFKAVYPEFAAKADEVVQAKITLADPHFDADRWDDLLTQGMAAWVAHALVCADLDAAVLAASAGSPSEVGATKLRAGDTEISTDGRVAVTQMKGSPFLRTAYGQQYLAMRRMVGLGAVAV
mgnify:FL=1